LLKSICNLVGEILFDKAKAEYVQSFPKSKRQGPAHLDCGFYLCWRVSCRQCLRKKHSTDMRFRRSALPRSDTAVPVTWRGCYCYTSDAYWATSPVGTLKAFPLHWPRPVARRCRCGAVAAQLLHRAANALASRIEGVSRRAFVL
jgi:hypothetical protein